ncbi:zinc finger protein [Penicillium herquei]|nr:zinc finger protein [Penicillium herquei]
MARLPYMDVSEDGPSKLHIIGKGFCGTVWAASEEGHAYKREDGGPDRSLENDFEMHNQILKSVKKFSNCYKTQNDLHIYIPACYNFISATEQAWWSTNLSRFPSGYTPCNILKSQRIPPFSQVVRQILIDNFRPPNIAKQITISKPDKDCLVRPYLGRRRTRRLNSTSQFTGFSLRNYPLHLDQMESLGITINDIQQYTRAMAEILALMHWVGKIDGNDIEFVLAPPRHDIPSATSSIRSNVLGEHVMWVLDFDLCRNMTMDLKGVEQAVAAFGAMIPTNLGHKLNRSCGMCSGINISE